MKCSESHEIIMRHFDHDLTDEEQRELDQHIHTCPDCRALMNDLHGILDTLETAPKLEPPADMENHVMNRIMSLDTSHENISNNFLKMLYGSMSAVAAIMACAITLGIYDGVLSFISQGADSLNSFIENAWNFQIIYNLLSDLFSQMISSITNTIKAVYLIAGIAAIIMGSKKLLLNIPVIQKAND